MDKKTKVWLYVLLFLLIAALVVCVIFKLTLDDVNAKYIAALDAAANATAEPYATPAESEEPTAEPVSATEEPTVAGYTADEVLTMATELDAANARVAELEGEVAELEGRVAELETEVESITAASADGTLAAEQLTEAQAENDSLKAELDSANAELATAEAELDAATAELEIVKAEADTAKTELETATAELETAKAELETAKAELNTAQADVERLQAENEALRGDLEAADARVAKLENELNGYRSADAAVGTEVGDNVRVSGKQAEFGYTNNAGLQAVCTLKLDGEALFVSEKLAPGENIESFELTKELAQGTYEAEFTVELYREDGSVSTRTILPVTIEAE